jgi:ABC-2 type transport system ATP-binding protein
VPDAVSPPTDFDGPRTADGFVEFSPEDLTAALHQLTGWAIEHAITLDDLHIIRPSLEDVYLQLTGEPAETADSPAPTGSERTPR